MTSEDDWKRQGLYMGPAVRPSRPPLPPRVQARPHELIHARSSTTSTRASRPSSRRTSRSGASTRRSPSSSLTSPSGRSRSASPSLSLSLRRSLSLSLTRAARSQGVRALARRHEGVPREVSEAARPSASLSFVPELLSTRTSRSPLTSCAHLERGGRERQTRPGLEAALEGKRAACAPCRPPLQPTLVARFHSPPTPLSSAPTPRAQA